MHLQARHSTSWFLVDLTKLQHPKETCTLISDVWNLRLCLKGKESCVTTYFAVQSVLKYFLYSLAMLWIASKASNYMHLKLLLCSFFCLILRLDVKYNTFLIYPHHSPSNSWVVFSPIVILSIYVYTHIILNIALWCHRCYLCICFQGW